MNLEEKINADIKTAMLAKEAKKLEALRAVKSATDWMPELGFTTSTLGTRPSRPTGAICSGL